MLFSELHPSKEKAYIAINKPYEGIKPMVTEIYTLTDPLNSNEETELMYLIAFWTSAITFAAAVILLLHVFKRNYRIDHRIFARNQNENNREYLSHLNRVSKTTGTEAVISPELEKSYEFLFKKWTNGENTADKLLQCFGYDFLDPALRPDFVDYINSRKVKFHQIDVCSKQELNNDDL
ncbi:unnamed protein product [Caenorhabditis auriculariae]|uniref:Uncharacterized protein n=1 Tax=Caenorhabditis auriculariae TaxID=2777116 RepID=A0A8S1HK69_9PELO|nr:unnamed protein product [Caenorhabditis auriculariae]